MIYRLETLLRRLRRWLSRPEWAARLLGLPRLPADRPSRGLVMLQIDGLSRTQLEHALQTGRMPFMQRLMQREEYRLHTLYSGMPSSTPAMQAELFYGVKGAIPAFAFRDRSTGRAVRMLEPATAEAAERELERLGAPLLVNGAAYADIFTGGAEEPHFCPASVGWGRLLRRANPIAQAIVALTYSYSLLRMVVLLLIEFSLAFYDFVVGVSSGRDVLAELRFVPTRTAISVLLRDLVRIGVEIDVARGMPAIHANFLGYDEQAHRRGPTSAFAHWSLKGIDDAISRIWRAARRSGRREYDIWIYSDHGQEDALSYPKQFGETIARAVARVLGHDSNAEAAMRLDRGIQSQRVRLLGSGRAIRYLPTHGEALRLDGASVVAPGPLGFIYLPRITTAAERAEMARRLVAEAGIPAVLAPEGPDQARVWIGAGDILLPDEAAALLGPDHPFLDEAARDLVALCHHPDSGDLLISGWCQGAPPLTFEFENGAHAGPGAEETRAFALLPRDTPLAERAHGYLRPLDLRRAALALLEGATDVGAPPSRRHDTRWSTSRRQ